MERRNLEWTVLVVDRAVPTGGRPSCAMIDKAVTAGCSPAGHPHVGAWWVSAGILVIGAAVFLAVAEWRPWRRLRSRTGGGAA